MHNFTYNNISLSSFGGRLLQPPTHTIAARNKSFAKIYGQSGDEIIDNESYNNVKFELKICFLPYLTQQAAQALAYAVIDWLAPLQDKYYEYRDTVNPNYFTYAVLTNFDQVVRELPTLLTTTLEFNRVPFWYSDNGASEITIDQSGGSTLTNPEKYTAEPVYKFYYPYQYSRDVVFTVNGVSTTESFSEPRTFYFDNVLKQHYYISYGEKKYISSVLLPDLQPGNNIISYDVGLASSSAYLIITPNWRRL